MTDSTFFILALLAAILFVFFLLWRNERALRRQEGGEHVKPPKPWPKPVEKLDVKLSVDDQFTPALVEVQAVTGRYFNRAEDRLPIVLLSAGDLDSIDDPEVAILQQQLDPGLILSVTGSEEGRTTVHHNRRIILDPIARAALRDKSAVTVITEGGKPVKVQLVFGARSNSVPEITIPAPTASESGPLGDPLSPAQQKEFMRVHDEILSRPDAPRSGLNPERSSRYTVEAAKEGAKRFQKIDLHTCQPIVVFERAGTVHYGDRPDFERAGTVHYGDRPDLVPHGPTPWLDAITSTLGDTAWASAACNHLQQILGTMEGVALLASLDARPSGSPWLTVRIPGPEGGLCVLGIARRRAANSIVLLIPQDKTLVTNWQPLALATWAEAVAGVLCWLKDPVQDIQVFRRLYLREVSNNPHHYLHRDAAPLPEKNPTAKLKDIVERRDPEPNHERVIALLDAIGDRTLRAALREHIDDLHDHSHYPPPTLMFFRTALPASLTEGRQVMPNKICCIHKETGQVETLSNLIPEDQERTLISHPQDVGVRQGPRSPATGPMHAGTEEMARQALRDLGWTHLFAVKEAPAYDSAGGVRDDAVRVRILGAKFPE